MQTISVLVCRPDGTQTLEEREVDDDYFTDFTPAAETPAGEATPTLEEQVAENSADIQTLTDGMNILLGEGTAANA